MTETAFGGQCYRVTRHGSHFLPLTRLPPCVGSDILSHFSVANGVSPLLLATADRKFHPNGGSSFTSQRVPAEHANGTFHEGAGS